MAQEVMASNAAQPANAIAAERQLIAMRRLVEAVQELSLARSVEAVQAVVRRAARELTGADGATFVLRDGDKCFYVDEDAIAPLWKGQRFPLSACISGWAMLNRSQAVIPDIYVDDRIPVDAYRPTFVKSLVMVPIRTAAPIGAIGNYWARHHAASDGEVDLLQALANTTAVALENVQLFAELEQRVADRTRALTEANRELEAFSYSVSHDLRAPLRAIDGFTHVIEEDYSSGLEPDGRAYLSRVRAAAKRMNQLIDDLLQLARVSRAEMKRDTVDLGAVAREIADGLRANEPARRVEFVVGDDLVATGDADLLRVVLDNLLGNAWKYTGRRETAQIEFGKTETAGGLEFFVRDNGAGFDPGHAARLFAPFQRLHSASDFPGTGVGLATVQRIVRRHGGMIRAEAAPNQGATFYFTLG